MELTSLLINPYSEWRHIVVFCAYFLNYLHLLISPVILLVDLDMFFTLLSFVILYKDMVTSFST